MSLVNIPRRNAAKAGPTGSANGNAAGALITGAGEGILREFLLSDTAGIAGAFTSYGVANAVEVIQGTGTLAVTDEGGAATYGSVQALPLGWSCDGLAISAITGGTVTAIRVRW